MGQPGPPERESHPTRFPALPVSAHARGRVALDRCCVVLGCRAVDEVLAYGQPLVAGVWVAAVGLAIGWDHRPGCVLSIM